MGHGSINGRAPAPGAPYSAPRFSAVAENHAFAVCCGRQLSEANVSPPWTVQVSRRRRAGAPLNRTRPSLSTSLRGMGVPSSSMMNGKALPFFVVLSRESPPFGLEWFKLTSASERQLEGPSHLLPRREPPAALSCLHASHRRVGCVNVMLRLCRTNHSPHERRGMHARDRFVVATDGTLITPSGRYTWIPPWISLP